MAQSLSEGSGGSESDSSKDEARVERPSRRADRLGRTPQDTLAICVVIPDLQQSVSTAQAGLGYSYCTCPGQRAFFLVG